MNYKDFYSYDMILRVGEFGAQQAASFPSSSLGGQLFARVNAAVARLQQEFAQQSSGRASEREGTASKAVVRSVLREALERMRRTARSMAVDMPELEAKFRLPRSQSDQEMVVTAEAFATDATPLKSQFIQYAMPADFLEQLRELIAEFRASLNKKETGRGNRVMAAAAIDDALEQALKDVRRLNAIVRNTFADDPEHLALWTTARHVQQSGRSKSAALVRPIPTQPEPVAQPSA